MNTYLTQKGNTAGPNIEAGNLAQAISRANRLGLEVVGELDMIDTGETDLKKAREVVRKSGEFEN